MNPKPQIFPLDLCLPVPIEQQHDNLAISPSRFLLSLSLLSAKISLATTLCDAHSVPSLPRGALSAALLSLSISTSHFLSAEAVKTRMQVRKAVISHSNAELSVILALSHQSRNMIAQIRNPLYELNKVIESNNKTETKSRCNGESKTKVKACIGKKQK